MTPQSAYAQHILQNIHEYDNLTDTTTLLQSIHNSTKLIPYEQLFIQNSTTMATSSMNSSPLIQTRYSG
jgi:Tfp pilus assembly protein FimT